MKSTLWIAAWFAVGLIGFALTPRLPPPNSRYDRLIFWTLVTGFAFVGPVALLLAGAIRWAENDPGGDP